VVQPIRKTRQDKTHPLKYTNIRIATFRACLVLSYTRHGAGRTLRERREGRGPMWGRTPPPVSLTDY
jgi:hypothetical protein